MDRKRLELVYSFNRSSAARRMRWSAASRRMLAAGLLLGLALAGPVRAQDDAPAAEAPAADAGRMTAPLLPAETKGYFAVPDLKELQTRWDQTQLGKMFALPEMKPFREDLQRQIDEKASQTGVRLGVQWADLEGIQNGEVAVASIQPGGDKDRYALALLADVTGNEDAAKNLLVKIARNMRQREAEQKVIAMEGAEVVSYTLPKERGQVDARQAFHALIDGWLVATDQADVMQDILARIGGKNGPSLNNLLAYAVVQQRCQDEAGTLPTHVRWFIEPFGYAEVARASADAREQRGRDKLKVLQRQGFDAIQGLGGVIALDVEQLEIVHHAFVFAPPVEPGKRFQLAARMLDFPNVAADKLAPPSWVPVDIAAYLTLHWKMQDAFYYSKSLVNDLADDEVFDDIWESIAKDDNGPRVDVPKEIVAHVGERLTVLIDRTLPVNERSEHRLFAFELENADAVKATVTRTMRRDPGVKEVKQGDHLVWQILNTKKGDTSKEKRGFGRFARKTEPKPDQQNPLFKNGGAITVAFGHLIYSTDIGLISRVLEASEQQNLGDTPDYKAVEQALTQLGSGEDCYRYFARTELTNHTNWELFRANKLPEAQSAFAKVLNAFMGSNEEGVVRKPGFDGSKLPPFEQVQGYMGPSGFYTRSLEDGWLIVGTLLEAD